MRGVDYRCKAHGIDLLLARDFPNTRAYVQGLGRVGRYGERCDRFKWSKLKTALINADEELLLRSKIALKLETKVPSTNTKSKTKVRKKKDEEDPKQPRINVKLRIVDKANPN